jgi:hypothetical protein
MVIHTYQLLKSLNPVMELVSEMMLPRNMAFLAPTRPMQGIDPRYAYLLAPA